MKARTKQEKLRAVRDYRSASLERLQSAWELSERGRWVESIYFSGVAFECMLNAYRVLNGVDRDDRHKLSQLATASGFERVVVPPVADATARGDADQYIAEMGVLMRWWTNGMRYWPESQYLRDYWKVKDRRRGKGVTIKQVADQVYNAADTLIRLGGARWPRLPKS